MLPVMTLIGRPNVGKSTLFNRLTRTRNALVSDFPGLTQDRQYGRTNIEGYEFICIDTGGAHNKQKKGLEKLIKEQRRIAINESNIILFLVDARAGLMPDDIYIAQELLRKHKPTIVIANKIVGLNIHSVLAEFWSLGLGKVYPIDASHNLGISDLLKIILLLWTKNLDLKTHNKYIEKEQEFNNPIHPTQEPQIYNQEKTIKSDKKYLYPSSSPIKVAIIGRPNVGKSTLTNCLLNEERVIVFDLPGTTRDSIYIPMQRHSRRYILIDTAGLRKRNNIQNIVEKYSIIKTIKAIEDANVAILVIDAYQGVSDQDLSLLSLILHNGRSLILVVNKWDTISKTRCNEVKILIQSRIKFLDFARIHFISAINQKGINNLFLSINEAYDCSIRPLKSSVLTKIINMAIAKHPPPRIRNRRIKLKYAHAGGYNPPIIVIHGNMTKFLPDSYKKYLINYFHQALHIIGAPIQIQLKDSRNPYIS
ncbi:ribosome biogenesis GTPase Der [Candidatus Erwinia haradaeae]|uniref:GTPase Der n=1 Tax=Candidatus Erwinia haradaeae TaxID=1922217 RepID=A0A451D8U5_9GAMM|nr:ribosome biogenesis GTPase Der [Candidatus Erwinia haradaeae]VFP82124.1 GTPase Der [Candidatus Erwinia haradaeae]